MNENMVTRTKSSPSYPRPLRRPLRAPKTIHLPSNNNNNNNSINEPLRRPKNLKSENQDSKSSEADKNEDEEKLRLKTALDQEETEKSKDGEDEEDQEKDPEMEELSKLTCPSISSEEVAEMEKRKAARRQRMAPDYPGLAFGVGPADNMMKFSIIRNELHNISKSQLTKVEGELSAFSVRVKAMDAALEKSAEFISTSTKALAEAVRLQMENDENKSEEDSEGEGGDILTEFDTQLRLLEGKFKILAASSSLRPNGVESNSCNNVDSLATVS